MLDDGLVLYIDEQLLLTTANFLLDYLLLWATAAITRTATHWRRLVIGAGLGTCYYAAYVLSIYRIIPFYGLLRMFPTVVSISFMMLAIAFAPMPITRFWSVVAHFYIISFISAGSGLAGAQLLGHPGVPNPLAGVLVALGSLLLVAELGWGVLQRRNWRQGLQMPLDITFGDTTVRITALLDTGNRLRDPLTGVPVVVVEHQALARLFPPHLSRVLERLESGDLRGITELVGSSVWSARFRIIPFTSVGAANGMMVGLRPDALTLWIGGKPHQTQKCIVALSPCTLDRSRMYKALISPDLVENTMTSHHHAAQGIAYYRSGNLKKEERAHAVTHG